MKFLEAIIAKAQTPSESKMDCKTFQFTVAIFYLISNFFWDLPFLKSK
ncbi:hypothetical protein FLJC2902T_26170 [Flavobacterium limnosediminis JC2902]|uniref:Uncharacterized protein n=1 Tax=Flavobacterium limnosediminis JC2902 TaxID=1341181 RepID=V6SK37_9FLAO|nr:hypothetical protein FLJC2902T_26170 [Flavobacterium limnosediminis JC2902]